MIVELNGAYGVVTFKVKRVDGTVQEVPNIDVFRLVDELAEATVRTADVTNPDGTVTKASTDHEINEAFKVILAKHGIDDAGGSLSCLFIASEIKALKDTLLKKFDATAEATIVA